MIYRYCRFIMKVFFRIFFHLQVRGEENVYKVRSAIVAANHTSFADPPLVGCSIQRKMYYMARDTLFKYRYFGALLREINTIPVNREMLNLSTFKNILGVLNSGNLLLMFPEGTRSPDGDLLPAQIGIGLIALKAKVPIIPVYIKGAFNAFPRHRNLIRPSKVYVNFGEPIFLDTWLKKSRIERSDQEEVAKLVMDRIKKLKMES